jgi:UDP-N-acetylmuramate--alanine ligase
MELSDKKHIHFIGIGGIGMSALARFFLHEGMLVSGSDRAPSALTSALVKEGATFYPTQVAENIAAGIDMVVYTEAMLHTHEEMVAAKALGVPMMNYFDALGLVANEYYLIAVAGAHGKTTTTAMLTDILEEASLDPTAIIGSLRSKTGSNFRAGKSKYAIVEACEYKRDFLSLQPDLLVITNIEHEHVDYYKDLLDVQTAFKELVSQVKEGGAVVAATKDPSLRHVLEGVQVTVIDYQPYIDLSLTLHQPGLHTRLNAAAASAAAAHLGVDQATVKTALEHFAGTWRRFEYKGTCNGALVYDDYAHHPTEIAATIAGVRERYPNKHLTVIFQSHTYTRTHELFTEFAHELAKADEVIMLPIYAAREVNISGVTAEQLVSAVGEKGTPTHFFNTLEAAALAAKEQASADNVIVVMGAGDVTQVATLLTT